MPKPSNAGQRSEEHSLINMLLDCSTNAGGLCAPRGSRRC